MDRKGAELMEFNNRLYQLRKQKGFSQEELANRLNVSRQTISKWELGDSTPNMEKLIALSDLFKISLDELVKGEISSVKSDFSSKSDTINLLNEKVLTPANKKKAKQGLKIVLIILGIVICIDIISMLVYFYLYGVPQ